MHKGWMFLWRLLWKVRSLWVRKGVEKGSPPPDFALFDLDGKVHHLYNAFPNKVVVLWLTNLCGGCEEKIPFVERLRQENRDALRVMAISILGKDRETPKRIQERHTMGFPLLLDPDDWVEKKLGLPHPADACPMFNLLVINRFGKVAYRTHLSAVDEAKLEAIVKSVVKEGWP